MTDIVGRFADVVRQEPVDLAAACLLISAAAAPGRSDALTTTSLLTLDELASRVPATGRVEDRLRHVLAPFEGTPEEYHSLEASLLSSVLQRRRGLPIMLSVVWLEVARRVEIPAYGVGLPGHFVVGIGDPDGHHVIVDPYRRGRSLRTAEVAELVGQPVGPRSLRPWDSVEILQRILANIRRWATPSDRLAVRRWALELALALPRHPLALRREHAEVLVSMGGFLEGAQALEEFAAVVEPADAAASRAALADARRARARLN